MSAPRWLAWCVTGCLAVAGLSGCDPPRRCEHEHDVDVALGSDGRSPGLRFEVPEGARSFTVVVIGDPEAAYRLGSFRIGGRELIDLGAVVDPGGPPEARSSTIQSPPTRTGPRASAARSDSRAA